MLVRSDANAAFAEPAREPESARLFADAALASAAVAMAPRSRARATPFGLDPRLRAADLRVMAREAVGRELAS